MCKALEPGERNWGRERAQSFRAQPPLHVHSKCRLSAPLKHFLTATTWGPSQPSPSAVLHTQCSSTSSLPPSTRAPLGPQSCSTSTLINASPSFRSHPSRNMLRRKLHQVGHNDKADCDAKVLQAEAPLLERPRTKSYSAHGNAAKS